MSSSLNLTAKNVSGYGPPDFSSFSRSPAAVCVSPCSSPGIFSKVNLRTTKRASGTPSFICNANSDGQRRNSDYSRQGRQIYSRNSNNRSRQNEERDIDADESELLMPSKNGPYFSNNSKSQTPAAPGAKEKEIVELFKRVQVQLRERAGLKGEKKVEASSQGQGADSKENETVGSLLNLLRKHSSVSSNENSSANQPEQTSGQSEDRSPIGGLSSIIRNSNGAVEPRETSSFNRPPSSFRRRSPVSKVTMPPPPPAGSSEDGIITPKPSVNSNDGKPKEYVVIPDEILEPEDEPEPEMLLSELDDDEEEEEEEEVDEIEDLSSLKISELKEMAKVRGIKRYSKMKKSELVEVLSGAMKSG